MPKKSTIRTQKQLVAENKDLRARLDEAEETLRAIRSGEVDALIVSGVGGEQIFTLKQAEEQILRQASMLESVNDAIVGSDAQYWLIAWNAGAESLYGWKAEEVLGRNGVEIIRTEWPKVEAEEMRRTIAKTGRWRGEATQARKDGTRFPVEISSVVLRDKRGQIAGYISVNRDISERKRAEQEIDRLAKFPSENPNPVLRLSRDGIVMYANAASGALLSKWGCAVGGSAPQFWRDLATQALVSRENKTVEVEWDGKVYSMFVTPVAEPDYVNLYGRDITERKRAEEKNQRQLEHLASLSTIDRVITSNFDLRVSFSEILNQVTVELGIDAADILVLNSSSQMLEFGAGRGFRTKAAEKARVRLGESHAGRAALERQLVKIPNPKDQPDNLLLSKHLAGEDFVCYYGVPLIAKGQVKGVLEVFHRTLFEPDAEWLNFLNALAEQTAIAIDNATLFENLQRSNADLSLAYDTTIEGWSHALDLRDKETEGHTQRVTETTLRLAKAMGIGDAELANVRRGALLHDIGKMGVPDEILLKPGKLTDEEWVAMRKHPQLAYDLLSPISYLHAALDIPYCHHEKWDGTGYPRGLKGEQIPLVARIFAIVDVWDALRSDRPYRKAWDEEKVREHILAGSGTHFDPQVVKVSLESGVLGTQAPE